MRFKIDRSALDQLDDEIIVQELAISIGDKCRPPTGNRWTAYSANPHLSAAQINVGLIGDALIEVLNGGLFQLIMNPAGGLIPDFPEAFRAIGRVEEARILDRVAAMFSDEATIRDHEKRVAFASTKIVPGGWDGLTTAKRTGKCKRLESLSDRLGDLMQSAALFSAVADYVRRAPDSFRVLDR